MESLASPVEFAVKFSTQKCNSEFFFQIRFKKREQFSLLLAPAFCTFANIVLTSHSKLPTPNFPIPTPNSKLPTSLSQLQTLLISLQNTKQKKSTSVKTDAFETIIRFIIFSFLLQDLLLLLLLLLELLSLLHERFLLAQQQCCLGAKV